MKISTMIAVAMYLQASYFAVSFPFYENSCMYS